MKWPVRATRICVPSGDSWACSAASASRTPRAARLPANSSRRTAEGCALGWKRTGAAGLGLAAADGQVLRIVGDPQTPGIGARPRRHEWAQPGQLIGVRGVDEDHAAHQLRKPPRENLDDQSPEGMSDEHIGRRERQVAEQATQIIGGAGGRARPRPRFARAQSGAIVQAHRGEGGDLPPHPPPGCLRAAEMRLEDDHRVAGAGDPGAEAMAADVNHPRDHSVTLLGLSPSR